MTKTTLYIPASLYLDYRNNVDMIVANFIGEKIKEIINTYGTNLKIRIKKVLHIDISQTLPVPIINGYVRCCLRDDNQFMYRPEEVREHLQNNWFDYEIEFEELEKDL